MEKKPHVNVSAATVTQPPPPDDEQEWRQKSAAYTEVFQDWRSWMSEGILDMNLPMIYSPHDDPGYHRLYTTWVDFAKQHRYKRHVVISPALYLNSVSGSIAQIREAMAPGKSGKPADGVCLYSYASPSKYPVTSQELLSALARPSRFSSDAPVFEKPVAVPDMPWKTKPTMGHLKGIIYTSAKTNVADGATITIKGPANRTTRSDGTGFYGSVDLLPGNYTVTSTYAGETSKTRSITIKKGKVATLDMGLGK